MFCVLITLFVGLQSAPAHSTTAAEARMPHVLVFSRTAGFRHSSIEAGVEAVQGLGGETYVIEHTEDPTWFTPQRLAKYDSVVFLNTTQDVLDAEQQQAFMDWYRDEGGYVGVHAAADTEYDWPWYGQLMGAYFKSHPQVQPADIVLEDRTHPAMQHLPAIWTCTDEWYDYRRSPREDVHVLARMDHDTYDGEGMDGDHPIVWCHAFDGGTAFYTGRGHTDESFDEPAFLEHLDRAIQWTIDDGWIDLVPESGTTGWVHADGWSSVAGVNPAEGTPPTFAVDVAASAHRVLVNTAGGKTWDLVSGIECGDAEIHLDFMVPEGSNSGVYVQGRYEIQIFDSHEQVAPQHNHCGGIYERWDEDRSPKGFEGHPPRVNAAGEPYTWQTYDIVFRAPRFDADGAKTENARFVRVEHNGQLIHENVELTGPTRAGFDGEVTAGPLRLQGDHGPIAYRNIRIRRVSDPAAE